MVKFSIIFRKPGNLDAFENSYNDFLALAERMPNILRRQVVNVIGSPTGKTAYYRILELYFADEQTLRAALTTPAGQEAGRQLYTFPRGSFEPFFAEVYEEAGGQTEQP